MNENLRLLFWPVRIKITNDKNRYKRRLRPQVTLKTITKNSCDNRNFAAEPKCQGNHSADFQPDQCSNNRSEYLSLVRRKAPSAFPPFGLRHAPMHSFFVGHFTLPVAPFGGRTFSIPILARIDAGRPKYDVTKRA